MFTRRFSSPRLFLATVTATALALSVLVAVPEHGRAADRPVVHQGSVVETSIASCTVGYVDKAKREAFISAHCGQAGEQISLISGGGYYRNVGTFYPSQQWDSATFSNDWARIRFNNSVDLGNNVFTGESTLDPDQLRNGEKICFHGQTTHPDGRSYSCNTIAGVVGSSIFFHGPKITQSGDSGGPVWVERAGQRYFVGVNSGWYGYLGPGNTIMGRVSDTEDREIATVEQIEKIYRSLVNPTPSATPSAEPAPPVPPAPPAPVPAPPAPSAEPAPTPPAPVPAPRPTPSQATRPTETQLPSPAPTPTLTASPTVTVTPKPTPEDKEPSAPSSSSTSQVGIIAAVASVLVVLLGLLGTHIVQFLR